MRQFRDLSDIVGLWKADKLDRQNPIQSSTVEFFEITTSVSFHECARGSIYYPYIPRRCFTSGKGIDRSRGGVRVAAWMRFELQKLTSRRDSLVIEYKMQFFKSLRTAVSRTSASLRPSSRRTWRRSFACAVIESTRGFRDAYMEIELPPICPDDAPGRISPSSA